MIEDAISAGASVAYLGVRHNLATDLTLEQMDNVDVLLDNMGEEGEVMYAWGPLFVGCQVPEDAREGTIAA